MLEPRTTSDGRPAPGTLVRWLPLLVLVAVAGIALALGCHRYLSFRTIGLNYEALRAFIAQHMLAALALFMVTYVVVVALSLPGALIMTLAGGLLFGWQLATPATLAAATLGATVLFLVARSSLCHTLADRAGPAIHRLRAGFQKNALSYMLFLRLVPVFPFVVVNLAAAALDVPLATFVLGTVIGIIPGTLAYTVAGAGLGSVIEAQNARYQACIAKLGSGADIESLCPYTIDTSAIITRELLAAFALLGLVALIPVALKKWKARNAAV